MRSLVILCCLFALVVSCVLGQQEPYSSPPQSPAPEPSTGSPPTEIGVPNDAPDSAPVAAPSTSNPPMTPTSPPVVVLPPSSNPVPPPAFIMPPFFITMPVSSPVPEVPSPGEPVNSPEIVVEPSANNPSAPESEPSSSEPSQDPIAVPSPISSPTATPAAEPQNSTTPTPASSASSISPIGNCFSTTANAKLVFFGYNATIATSRPALASELNFSGGTPPASLTFYTGVNLLAVVVNTSSSFNGVVRWQIGNLIASVDLSSNSSSRCPDDIQFSLSFPNATSSADVSSSYAQTLADALEYPVEFISVIANQAKRDAVNVDVTLSSNSTSNVVAALAYSTITSQGIPTSTATGPVATSQPTLTSTDIPISNAVDVTSPSSGPGSWTPSTPSSPPTFLPPSISGLIGGAIAAIVLGAVAFVIIVLIIVCAIYHRGSVLDRDEESAELADLPSSRAPTTQAVAAPVIVEHTSSHLPPAPHMQHDDDDTASSDEESEEDDEENSSDFVTPESSSEESD